jgi:hypothetical protein
VQELGMVGMVTPQHVLATVVPVAEVETALARQARAGDPAGPGPDAAGPEAAGSSGGGPAA